MRLRLTLRGLLRAPAFALASIGTIALAVGLSTTVFAVVDGVLFKPLPYPQADDLMVVRGQPTGRDQGTLSWPDRQRLQAASADTQMTVYGNWVVFKHPAGAHLEVRGVNVDRRFFDVLGIRPFAGGFEDADFRQSYVKDWIRPAMVGFEFWRDYVGGPAKPVGSMFELRGDRFRVAGVLPPGFVFPHERHSRLELLFAMPDARAENQDRWNRDYTTLVRVPTPAAASLREKWSAVMTSTRHEYGPAAPAGEQPYDRVTLTPLAQMLGTAERPFFMVAFAGAAWLVLIACINVAGLSLARTRSRARELRLCVALGAGRPQIAQMVIAETLILTATGAAVGLALTQSLLIVVQEQLPQGLNLLRPLAIDWRVVVFAVLAPLTSMLALSVIPLNRAFREAPSGSAAPTVTPRARSWGASTLLAFESGLGVAVLVIGSLVLASFAVLRSEPSGFADGRLIVANLGIVVAQDRPEQRAAVQNDLLARLAAVPGIQDAALVGGTLFERSYSALALEPPAHAPDLHVAHVPVSEQFFEIAGLTLEEGRLPTVDEIRRGDPVAVVSRPAVRGLWGDGPALGRAVRARWDPNVYTVIGVVSDVRTAAQSEGRIGEAFTPMARSEHGRMFAQYVLRATGDPHAASQDVRKALARDVPGIFLDRIEPFANAVADTVRLQRFQASVFGTAAAAAVLLLSVGVAGIVATSVRRRWREIGIRSALGASSGRIVRLLVADHLRPAAAGIALGLLGGWWIKDVMRTFLYQLEPGDGRVWALASVFIVIMVTIAAWLPARRAAEADPAMVLRIE